MKKKPISDHAESVLRMLPTVAQEINPGVRGVLLMHGYAEIVQLPSPYAKHKGRNTDHYAATEKGRRYLKDGI